MSEVKLKRPSVGLWCHGEHPLWDGYWYITTCTGEHKRCKHDQEAGFLSTKEFLIYSEYIEQQLTEANRRGEEFRHLVSGLVSAVRSVNKSSQHKVVVMGDDEPCYYQRKEWIDWVLELADMADTATSKRGGAK
jgi:hypothetical protein